MTKASLFLDDDPLDLPSLYDPVEEDFDPPVAAKFDWLLRSEPRPAQDIGVKSFIGNEALQLMEFSFDCGRLATLIKDFGPMAIERLADEEAVALSWWVGDRISASDLALWRGFRLGATGSESQGHSRAAWAARHLATGSQDPLWPDTILEEIKNKHRDFDSLPQLLQAALLFYEAVDAPAEPSPARLIEAAVYASRLAVRDQALLPFLPLALTSVSGLRASGSLQKRLGLWLKASHQAVLAAILKLERIKIWRIQAEEAISDLSGRTPRILIECLIQHPILSAVTVAESCKVSRASAERNLTIFQTRGLTNEITGQARFRIWSAKF